MAGARRPRPPMSRRSTPRLVPPLEQALQGRDGLLDAELVFLVYVADFHRQASARVGDLIAGAGHLVEEEVRPRPRFGPLPARLGDLVFPGLQERLPLPALADMHA